ncbi:MAG: dienelactone hydrolase family protein [Gemmatimonadota bacterium]|nr:MAG: dienelactone hydrolase family protein [Gemmatimonadota bacterium]
MLTLPERPRLLFVLAHGAGAGMQHPFLKSTAELLARRSIGTLRYQFPYMEAGRRRPDPPHLLQATVRSAVAAGISLAAGIPVVAGGKSMGGRMASGAAAAGGLPGLSGLVFLGFPLHPPGRPDTQRSRHLEKVSLPLLFLQGTRDNLADLNLLRPLCERLGARATLHVVEGADHSFRVLKRSGRTDQAVLEELVGAISAWCATLL